MTQRVLWIRAQYLEAGDRVITGVGAKSKIQMVTKITPITPITRPVYIDLELDGIVTKEHVANLYCLSLTHTYGEKLCSRD